MSELGPAIDAERLKQAMLAAGPVGGVHAIDFQQAFASVHLSQQQLAMEFAEAVATAYNAQVADVTADSLPQRSRDAIVALGDLLVAEHGESCDCDTCLAVQALVDAEMRR